MIISADSSILAAESGMRLLEQVLNHTGDRVIRTGEFRYKLNIVDPPTSEMINRSIDAVRAALQSRLNSVELSEDLRASHEKGIETADQYVPEQLKKNSNRTMQYYFALGGPRLGGDRYAEFSIMDSDTNLPGPRVTLLQRSLGAGNGSSLRCDDRDRMAIVGTNSVSSGSQEPQLLGRAVGVLALLSSMVDASDSGALRDSVARIETRSFDNAKEASVKELICRITLSGAQSATLVCRVDPSRGFITPLVRELDSKDRVTREWQCEDYFLPVNSDLWFPRTCVYREYDHSSLGLEPRVERYTFLTDGVTLNHTIPEDRFRVTVQQETHLADTRGGEYSEYVATTTMDVSLDDIENITSIPGLTLYEPGDMDGRSFAAFAGNSWRFRVIVGSGVLLCVIWGVLWTKSGRSAYLFVVFGLSASAWGCDIATVGDLAIHQGRIKVTPGEIDLGEVATDLGEVEFSIKVENVVKESVQVKVEPSCGCALVDEPEFTIPGKGVREVTLSLSLKGRSGRFRSDVLVFCCDSQSPQAFEKTRVPVYADLLGQWSARPQRLVLSGGGTGLFSISAPRASWKGVRMEAPDVGIQVSDSSSEIIGTLEVRSYQVAVCPDFRSENSGISLYRESAKDPFLIVPVLIR